MFELKETFNVTVENQKKKKIKGASYFSPELNRDLFIHPDIDNEKHTSVSDKITGYRLFYFPEKHDKIKEEQIALRINEYIKHYSLKGIQEEFERVEKLQQEETKR